MWLHLNVYQKYNACTFIIQGKKLSILVNVIINVETIHKYVCCYTRQKKKYTLGILLEHSSCPWHLEHLWLACTLRSESKDTIKKLYICIYKVIPNLKIQIYNFAFFMLFI